MERVLKDDDVSGSSFSSCQLDCEAIGLAARVDHHHLDTTKYELAAQSKHADDIQ